MIDLISGRQLRDLAEAEGDRYVSIYLPTHEVGEATAQDPIRLKNLVARAIRELESLGVRSPQARELVAPVVELQEDAMFWAHMGQGLAVFVTTDSISVFRLPIPVEELVVVADRFHVKPLLPLVSAGEVFHVLVLSQNEVRLLRGTRFDLAELALGEIPESLAEALWFDDRESQLQLHGAARSGRGDVVAIFHGHGVGKDTQSIDLARFLAAVDAGVQQILGDDPAPVVLAGVQDTVSRYRQLSKLPRLCDPAVEGNAELSSPAELHAQAWPIVSRVFEEDKRQARESVLAGATPTVSTFSEAITAAYQGRIANLFVPIGAHLWGRFDVDRQEAEEHQERQPGDRDLYDAVAIETLAHGGSVFAVNRSDIPGDGAVAAVLRF